METADEWKELEFLVRGSTPHERSETLLNLVEASRRAAQSGKDMSWLYEAMYDAMPLEWRDVDEGGFVEAIDALLGDSDPERSEAMARALEEEMPKEMQEGEYPYFGACPILVDGLPCGRNDGYMNVRSVHFIVCERHRTKWAIGSNVFSSWKDETEDLWRANARKLAEYEEVEPVRGHRPSPVALPCKDA